MTTNSSKPILAVFDFDGTLTYRDSFTLFLREELGIVRYLTGLLGLAVPAACFAVGIISRDELKEKLMRPNGIAEVTEQLRQGSKVTLCSASPELILKPFADRLGIELIATRLEERNGVLTGKIDGQNCRQSEKVLRLKHEIGELDKYYVKAWGDSAGDKHLLEFANEPYYRKFH